MIRKTAHIVMAFNKRGVAYARFNAIGVNSALNKIIHLAEVLSELQRIENGNAVNDELLDLIEMIADILGGMKEESE